MKTPKNRTRADNPNEVVVVSGGVQNAGYHEDEAGPSAWRIESSAGTMHATSVLSWAVDLAARSPENRQIIESSEPFEVFVISDTGLTDSDRQIASSISSINVGTFTEAQKLAKDARWLQLPTWATPDQIAKLAAIEVQALRSGKPEVSPSEIIILVWKRCPGSFGGALMMEIGQKVCDAVFTCGFENVPAFLEGQSEDGTGE